MAAQTGHHVTIIEINEDAVKKARNGIESSLQKVAKKLYKVYTYCLSYIILPEEFKSVRIWKASCLCLLGKDVKRGTINRIKFINFLLYAKE